MEIKILNKGNRNQLICERKDGSAEIADLGPKLPFHDVAHFVVERQLKLKRGFYGNIYAGYSVKQLSDKEVIKTLPLESAVAEVVTRALQSLAAGACTPEQFIPLIDEELRLCPIEFPLNFTQREIEQMLSDYKDLITQWEQLKEGEALRLKLETEDWE